MSAALTGRVKFFDEVRGYGFIVTDNGDDLFFHITSLREGDDVRQGAVVTFKRGVSRKTGRPQAIEVDLL